MLADPLQLIEPHPNSLLFATGKGGVGKSTTASHYAGDSAAQGRRTLLVCVTSQEEDDLGIVKNQAGVHPDGDSVLDGNGLYAAIHDRRPLSPIREVRPNLDVVPGGTKVGDIHTLLTMRMLQEGSGVALALAQSLAPIAHQYGCIVFDSAPENDALEQLAAAAARKMFIPTRSDESSINGLKRIARNYRTVKSQVNPHLEVGGVFLYASNASATSLHEEVRDSVVDILGPNTPMLSTVVGYREKPAVRARKNGLLFWEYERRLPRSARSYDVAAGRAEWKDVVPESIVPLARDMRNLTGEVFEYSKKGAA